MAIKKKSKKNKNWINLVGGPSNMPPLALRSFVYILETLKPYIAFGYRY
jgi:hypothetical protein